MNRIIVIIIVLLAAGGLFFGLTSGKGRNAAPEEKEKPKKKANGTPKEKPAQDPTGWSGEKIFRFPLETNPPTLDPVQIQDVTSDGVARKIFNGLVRFDKDMKPVPDLAERWDFSASENSYTFVLRKGVKFHNGREMKAADVKFSWERLLDPNVSQRLQILEPVVGARARIDGKAKETSGLQVVDDYTFKVALTGPAPTFILEIGMVNASVIPREAVEAALEEKTDFSRKPVGTGPFKMKEWRENSWMILTRHDDYFKGRPKLDGIEYEIIPESQMRLEQFKKGKFHVSDIPFGQWKNMLQERPADVSKNETFRTNYLGISMQKLGPGGKFVPAVPLGVTPLVREAINHAINREYICDTILEGRGKPATTIIPPGMAGYDPELKSWTYSLSKAKGIMSKAEHQDGQGLPVLTFLHRNDPDVKKVALAIHQDLEGLGLKVNLQALDWSEFLERVAKNPPDLFLLGWVADYDDPDNFLYYLFHSKNFGSAGNETRYSKAEVDALLEKARTTMEQGERIKLYRQAERQILADCPWILIENRINCICLQYYVRGVREQLTRLDVGQGLNQVEFSEVDFRK